MILFTRVGVASFEDPGRPTAWKEYLGWGLWLNKGDDFEMLQLIWPTTEGTWPWSPDKSEFYEWAQPILNSEGLLNEI